MKRDNTHRNARPGQFDRLRRLVRSRFGDAVREALGAVGACLRQSRLPLSDAAPLAEPATDSLTGTPAHTPTALTDDSIPLEIQAPRPMPPKWARECLAILVADVSGRILQAQREMDRLTAAYAGLDHVPGSNAMPTVPHGLVDPSLEALAVRLATVMTAADPDGYEQYARLVRAVSPRPWELDQHNPLGALVFARALISCVADCLTTAEQRALLMPTLLEDCGPHFLSGIVATTEFMREIGIKPAAGPIRFSYQAYAEQRPVHAVAAPSLPVHAVAADRNGDRAGAQMTVSSPGHALDQPVASGSPEAVTPADAALMPAPRSIERLALADAASSARQVGPAAARIRSRVAGQGDGQARAAVRSVARLEADAVAFAHSVNEVPFSRASRQRFFAQVRSALTDDHCSAVQLSTVDLVAAMFDYVIDDRTVPVAAQPMIWRLQQPALVLALLDPGYLGGQPHSLRSLLDNVGALVCSDGFDGHADSAALRRLGTLVRATEIVSHRLAGQVQHLSARIDAEYARCAAGVAQLVDRVARDRRALEGAPGHRNRRDFSRRPGRTQEREVTEKLTAMLTDKTAGLVLPESVDSFLQSVWLRYLRTALLREGEHSERYRNAERLVDDLLWTLNPQAGTGSRRELAQRIPVLIRAVITGLHEVGARAEDHQGFFDELFLIHLRKLHRLRAGGPDASGDEFTADDETAPPVLEHALPTASMPPQTTVMGPHSQRRGGSERRTSGQRPPDDEAPPAGVGTTVNSAAVSNVTSRLGPVTEAAASLASNDDNVSEATRPIGGNRMLEMLQAIDLEDLPVDPRDATDLANADLSALARGNWLEYQHSDGRIVYLKVAWLNKKGSVALLVRHPDRRALSKPLSLLRTLARKGRLRLVRTQAAA